MELKKKVATDVATPSQEESPLGKPPKYLVALRAIARDKGFKGDLKAAEMRHMEAFLREKGFWIDLKPDCTGFNVTVLGKC